MSDDDSLVIGSPRLVDADFAATVRPQSLVEAWRIAWRIHGPAFLARVQGEFAAAVRVGSNAALLAVDRFAVHTMCYRVIDGKLHFAERADELARIAPTVGIDPQAIYDYLYFHAIPSPRTIFKGVARVPPAHFVLFENGKLEVSRYWTPRFEDSRRASFEPLAAEFRKLLEESVASRLDGSKPACFLSGGTDSSTVAGMIRRVAGRPAATYSIGFDAEGYDEMRFARIAARRFSTEHHERYVTPDDVAWTVPKVAAHFDQPFGNSSSLPAYLCAEMARDDGVTLLLAGDGGDELFGGNTRYAKQRVFDWYAALPSAMRRRILEPILGAEAAARVAGLRKAKSYVEQARVPMPDRLQNYNLLLRLDPQQVLEPGLLAQVDPSAPAAQQRGVWSEARTNSTLNRTLAFDWRFTLAESDLPKVRESSRLAAVGTTFPFLDDRLLEFSMRLPAHYKVKRFQLRWFFKQALRDFLPEEIIAKRKHGFGLPFGLWATRHPGLLGLATDSLRSVAERGIVRPAFATQLLRDLLPAHPGYYGEMVWILMTLEQWLLRHAPEFRAR